MSIAVLNQVYDETRRLAIAGANLASGDFRLKKLVEPLERAGAKAPVFAKVAEAIQKVVDSTAQNSAEALLELSTLVTAILYTQGETGVAGKLAAIETQNFGLPTSDASARVLKPLLEALTTTGSGRTEIIRDAHQRGAFQDLRLVKPAVAAIDDVYGEIGDFIADQVLPVYGKAIYGDLRATFDVKGKGGHVRRLRVMHRLDAEQTRGLVEEALESGSKDMKIAAMECLRGSKEHVSYLLEQAKAKAKDVRRAALEGIGEIDDPAVIETLQKALTGADIDLAVGPASRSGSKKLLQFLLEEGRRQFDELFTTNAKAKRKTQLARFKTFLLCFRARTDQESESFLNGCFARRGELMDLKGDVSGEDILERITRLLVHNDSKAGQAMLVDGHEAFSPTMLGLSMLAAMRTRKPNEVFDLFSPYFTATPGKKKGRDPVREKREVVQETLRAVAAGYRDHRYYGHGGYDHNLGDYGEWINNITLAPDWLDAAIDQQELETVMALARPKHKAANEFLAKAFDAVLNKKSNDLDYEVSRVLGTMAKIDHPQVAACFVAALAKAGESKANRYYYAWWLLRLIPDLPKSAAARIEALVPSLKNERLIDEIIPYLEQLKAK